MKKQVAFIVAALILIGCVAGCASTPPDSDAVQINPANTSTPTAPIANSGKEPEAVPTGEQDTLNVDKGIFNVTMTIPSDFMGEGLTQQQCDELAKEKGFKSVTLNADGSATYVVTKAQHAIMMDELRETINQGLADMVDSGDFPNYVSVKANDTFTDFTVVIKSEELSLMDSLSVMGLYMYGGMFNAFNGTPADNISVSFVNESSGKVISEANSRDMQD